MRMDYGKKILIEIDGKDVPLNCLMAKRLKIKFVFILCVFYKDDCGVMEQADNCYNIPPTYAVKKKTKRK